MLTKTVKLVAGLNVNVFSYNGLLECPNPVSLLFLLHGRLESAESVEPIARGLLEQTYAQSNVALGKDLVIVTFDHRNHGTRLVNPQANQDWKAQNSSHALDMYAIQVGTATDVSLLIDFLPAYLFPLGERTIIDWMVAGISLGGHSTWILLNKEPRIKIGIPIIGCPDYLSLMGPRAEASGYSISSPYFPPALLAYIRKCDPPSSDYASLNPSNNPFLGKHILVLSGEDDTLVPWSASEHFVNKLNTGDGKKKILVEKGVGHECTPAMVQELCYFIWEVSLKSVRPSHQL